MGSENSYIKQKKRNTFCYSKNKKVENQKNLEDIENKKPSENLEKESEILETDPQSKTMKFTNQNCLEQPDTEPESDMDKRLLERKNQLKSLSAQNLVKLDESPNLEEGLDSLENNCYSNKTKEDIRKLLNDEVYDHMEDNNSFGDEEYENNEEADNDEKENEETEEEKKNNKLMVTNNIKTIFKDSQIVNKELFEHNESAINEDNSGLSSTSSMTAYDYELYFYRNGNDIRRSYFTKLVTKQIWTPNMKPKQHNSLIIFDWDDTLLPTSFLTPGAVFDENSKLSENAKEKFLKLEQAVLKLLTEAVEKGTVYIITNAGKGWVEYSANRFYPQILPILEKIKIISARGKYEKFYPGNSKQWKIEAFLNLRKSLNMKLVTNIICIGDSLFEMEAGRILASKFTNAFIKTIKFREAPKLDELLKQMKLVCTQFNSIYLAIKNLTIRVERKKKE